MKTPSRIVAEAGPIDAQLPHLRPQRVGIDLQQRGGALPALDAAPGDGQGRLDVPPNGRVERLDRSGRPAAAAERRRRSMLPAAVCRTSSAPMPSALATSNRLPSPRIAARSITAPSSRTFPGQAIRRQQRQVLRRGRGRRQPEPRGRPLGKMPRPAGRCPRGAPAAAAARSGNTAMRYQRSSRNRPSATIDGQIAVRGGDDPHVDVDRLLAADAFHPAVLQDAQHADLGGRRQLADLVEKQRAAVGPLEPAAAGFDRAR